MDITYKEVLTARDACKRTKGGYTRLAFAIRLLSRLVETWPECYYCKGAGEVDVEGYDGDEAEGAEYRTWTEECELCEGTGHPRLVLTDNGQIADKETMLYRKA